jgi:hypothetical protein
MSRNLPTGRALVLLTGVAAVAAFVWAVAGNVPARAESSGGGHAAELTGIDRDRSASPYAHVEGVQTATSVCDAQRLKAAKAENPDLEIEIPQEFDRQFPTLSACESHELAWDDAADGPRQPIPFSHAHHAGMYQIDCLYCHSGTDRAAVAGMPSVQLCMGCHANFPAEYDELEGIQILKQHWEDREPVQWEQIHRLPEHVQFRHNRHIAAGLACNTCHGSAEEPVEKAQKLRLVPDTKWWFYGLPTKKLEMGWCIKCHRQNGASQDCLTCHY